MDANIELLEILLRKIKSLEIGEDVLVGAMRNTRHGKAILPMLLERFEIGISEITIETACNSLVDNQGFLKFILEYGQSDNLASDVLANIPYHNQDGILSFILRRFPDAEVTARTVDFVILGGIQ